ncbi:MAG: imidazoleglycerol-phosphate dehydratase HisB [Erysipelotrichaceae bacterium]|nr:imidazoleglycerol-phosphate dehydratase HisB [Erysipelotrichaceae bacterium]
MSRNSQIERNTTETQIKINFELDGTGTYKIASGVRFFDHMLELFTRHGRFTLSVACVGDVDVDAHHSVEDIGICLGLAIKEAMGDKKGILRYATAFTPMDEALSRVSLDISNRSFLVFDSTFTNDRVGDLPTELVEEFFRAVAFNAGLTLHIAVEYGKNNHHMIEAIFKGFGRALREATRIDATMDGVMSTKGQL